MRCAALVLVLALVGCGGSRRGGGDTPTALPEGDGGVPTGETDRPTDDAGVTGLTETECDALLDHLIAVERRAQAADADPEHQPTDEQVAEIRARMRETFMAPCLRSSRELYQCAMRAQTREEFAACQESAGR